MCHVERGMADAGPRLNVSISCLLNRLAPVLSPLPISERPLLSKEDVPMLSPVCLASFLSSSPQLMASALRLFEGVASAQAPAVRASDKAAS